MPCPLGPSHRLPRQVLGRVEPTCLGAAGTAVRQASAKSAATQKRSGRVPHPSAHRRSICGGDIRPVRLNDVDLGHEQLESQAVGGEREQAHHQVRHAVMDRQRDRRAVESRQRTSRQCGGVGAGGGCRHGELGIAKPADGYAIVCALAVQHRKNRICAHHPGDLERRHSTRQRFEIAPGARRARRSGPLGENRVAGQPAIVAVEQCDGRKPYVARGCRAERQQRIVRHAVHGRIPRRTGRLRDVMPDDRHPGTSRGQPQRLGAQRLERES